MPSMSKQTYFLEEYRDREQRDSKKWLCVCESLSGINWDASLIKDASSAYVTNPLHEACRSFLTHAKDFRQDPKWLVFGDNFHGGFRCSVE